MTCPFCRCEIRSTEQVVVDPFHRDDSDDVTASTPELRKVNSVDDDDSGNFEVETRSLMYHSVSHASSAPLLATRVGSL